MKGDTNMKPHGNHKKSAVAVTLALTITLMLTACATPQPPAAPITPASSAAPAPVSSAVSEEVNQGGEYAFFAVIDWLWQEDTALNDDIEYLSVDFTGIEDEEAAALTALLEDFCAEHTLTLLTLGYDKLVEDGYIEDLFFPDGILFAFEEAELTDTTLNVKARKWRSGRAAIGGDFTVEKQDGVWSVAQTKNNWIS